MRRRLSLARFLLEATFLVLVAAAAGLAGLDAIWIGVVMFGAWLLVALIERAGSRRHRAPAEPPPEQAVEAEPEVVSEPEPEPEPEPAPAPVLVAVPAPPPEPEPEPEPEPAPTIVPLVPRETLPRTWNLWDLERLAEQMNGDAATEERGLLLLHMREFADASGDLPIEFDPLVRDAFGTGLAGLPR